MDKIRNINTRLSLRFEGIMIARMNEAKMKNNIIILKLIFIPSLAFELLRTSINNKPAIIEISALIQLTNLYD
jgi:hypothetical protein